MRSKMRKNGSRLRKCSLTAFSRARHAPFEDEDEVGYPPSKEEQL